MRRVLLSVLAISVVVLVFVGYLFVRDVSRAFPDLPAGTYMGIVFYSEHERGVPLYVERGSESQRLIVALGDARFPAQHAPVRDPSGNDRLPLIVSGPEVRLRLTGVRKGDDLYEGECIDPIGNRTGTWHLRKIDLPRELDREDDDLQGWITLVDELHKVESAIETLKRSYDVQKVKLERLNRYLVDDESLKQKATSRLSNTSNALEEERGALGKLQAELDGAIRNVELSQRVSPKGRLVVLSRESLQRESRWIEITLKLLAPETSPGFEEQLERAVRIKAVQDEIETERRRMEEIDTLDRYRGEGGETSHEEEFYRGLQ